MRELSEMTKEELRTEHTRLTSILCNTAIKSPKYEKIEQRADEVIDLLMPKLKGLINGKVE